MFLFFSPNAQSLLSCRLRSQMSWNSSSLEEKISAAFGLGIRPVSISERRLRALDGFGNSAAQAPTKALGAVNAKARKRALRRLRAGWGDDCHTLNIHGTAHTPAWILSPVARFHIRIKPAYDRLEGLDLNHETCLKGHDPTLEILVPASKDSAPIAATQAPSERDEHGLPKENPERLPECLAV